MGNYIGTTSGAQRIELQWLRRHGYLTGYTHFNLIWSRNGEPTGNINVFINVGDNPQIRLTYKVRPHGEEEWREMDYSFPMTKLPCRYGGCKWFFTCQLYRNGFYCGKRVRILYNAGNYFGCRHCANLSYNSCNKTKSGIWGVLSTLWDADDYYVTLKRYSYRGKPTRKYRKFLKMSRYSPREETLLHRFINNGMSTKK